MLFRNIPADSGWILDGFPVDISQAQMLEKALNVTEPDETETKTQSSLSTNTPKDPSPPSPALDVVLLLDVSDEQVLERATHQAGEFMQIEMPDIINYSVTLSNMTGIVVFSME